MSEPFFTIGHSTNTLEEFVGFVSHAEVELVVDVRKLTGSRRFPHFNAQVLATALPATNIRYTTFAELGGRRRKSTTIPPEVNGMWQNQSFHNYADYTLTEEFQSALGTLREWGEESRLAVMCSEAVWWRCHRRLIADQLLARGEEVVHIIGRKLEPATLMKGAVVGSDGQVRYPATQAGP